MRAWRSLSPAEKVDAFIFATSFFPALEGRVVERVVLPFVEQFSINRHERYAFLLGGLLDDNSDTLVVRGANKLSGSLVFQRWHW